MYESHFHCIKQTLTGIIYNQFEMCLVQCSTNVLKNLGCTVQQLVVLVPCIRSLCTSGLVYMFFRDRHFARRLQRAVVTGGWIKSRNESFNSFLFRLRHPLAERCTNPEHNLAVTTKFCAVVLT